jgi:hypothetical protein
VLARVLEESKKTTYQGGSQTETSNSFGLGKDDQALAMAVEQSMQEFSGDITALSTVIHDNPSYRKRDEGV